MGCLLSAPHDPSALSVNLAAIPAGGAPVAVAADDAALGFSGAGFEVVGELNLRGRLHRLERDGFRLSARLGGALRLECVRCLGPVALPVDEDLDLVYLPRTAESAALTGGERALEASDMNVSFFRDDRLELAETIWEQLHLALPVKPLCSADCLGLCNACGADRNRQPACGCEDAARSTGRTGLAALRDLPGLRRPPG
jgi:uncharacterized protein